MTGNKPGYKDQETEKQAVAELGIEILRFPLRGNGSGDISNYAQAIAAIVDAKEKDKPLLVNCAADTQRTGGVTACYRMLIEKKSPSFAYAEMRRYDWDPDDNPVLLSYINNNMAELSRLLKEMRVIDEVPDPLPVLGP